MPAHTSWPDAIRGEPRFFALLHVLCTINCQAVNTNTALLQVTLPQTSGQSDEKSERELDMQLASLREQILMVCCMCHPCYASLTSRLWHEV